VEAHGVVVFGVLLPVVLVAIVAVWAMLTIRRSTLRVTAAGVEFRNYPQPVQSFPLDRVACFDEPTRVGFLSSLQPRTCVLVLRDGTRLAVRSTFAPEAGHGVDALNERLARLRRP
jgi:hypothetical protein